MIRASRPIRWVSLGLACLLALPLPLGLFAGFYLRLSPFLALQSLASRAPLSLLALPAGAVLLLIVWRERWFCANVCPTGALCDAVSSCRRKKSLSWDRIPNLNQVLAVAALALATCGTPLLAVLDPLALFHCAWSPLHQGLTDVAGLSVLGLAVLLLTSLLFPRLWCAKLCPLGGLQVLLANLCRALKRRPTPAASQSTPEPDPTLGRRSLLAASVGIAGGLILRRTAAQEETNVLRPPGALPGTRFATTCCRCGNCVRACPTRIIHPAFDVRDPMGLLAPEVRFSTGYCLPTCEACGHSCPTGAIAPFGVGEKQRLFIGTAQIRVDDCLVVEGQECDRCAANCAYQAVEISDALFEPQPEVNASRCVGCGACALVCPAKVIEIVLLRSPGEVLKPSLSSPRDKLG